VRAETARIASPFGYAQRWTVDGARDDDRMRIVHVVTRSHRRGAEIVATELADELDALGHDDRLVALVRAFDGGLDARLQPLVDTKAINVRTMVESGWRLRRTLSNEQADVVVAHGGWSAQVAALALSKRRHGKLVWQRILGIPDRAWHGPRRVYWQAIARRFDAAIVLSTELESEMTRLGYPGPVWSIPNARNPARFERIDRDEAATRLRAELGIENDVPLVGFVGHLIAQKQPELAVDALLEMHRVGRPAHLVVVGDGPLRATVEQHIARNGVQASVTLLGHRDETEWIYGGIDLLLLTSASEGVPGVVIEAQMAGCPVVSFPTGAVTDVVDDLETGIVVDRPDVVLLARAAADLLADDATRLGMSKVARERSDRHSTAHTALLYERHLRDLVS
jgi:glycosyltransferase involved in cell wall biosynthesis